MNTFYIKNNNQRNRNFQIRTIIYEENGKKFVKKEAIHPDAVPHIKAMKKNYECLNKSIINPDLKLVKIISETETALVFEYIEGVSFREKYFAALNENINKAFPHIFLILALLSSCFVLFDLIHFIYLLNNRLFP